MLSYNSDVRPTSAFLSANQLKHLSMFTPPRYPGSDDFKNIMDDLYRRGQSLRENDPETCYHVRAYSNDILKWVEQTRDKTERDELVDQAVTAGFDCTVEPQVEPH